MKNEEMVCTWGEALRLTLIIMFYIIGFWSLFFLMYWVIINFEQIKNIIGIGGDIL